MEKKRPDFFKYCPVCDAETPAGSLNCLECGVDLEIARSNILENKLVKSVKLNDRAGKQLNLSQEGIDDTENKQKFLRDNLEHSLGGCSYTLIGFLFANFLPVALYLFVYVLPFSDSTALFAILSLLGFFAIIYFSTIGRYGEMYFYGLINIAVWSLIPLANWWVAYYLGKGLHMKLSKQKLYSPPKPTGVGLIILIVTFVILSINWMDITSHQPFSVIVPTQTQRPTRTPRSNATSAPTRNPCYQWDEITPKMDGRTVCVFGVVRDHKENWENELTNLYFGTSEQFFIVSNNRWTDSFEGKCVTTTGKIQLNTYKVPYIKVDKEIYNCTP